MPGALWARERVKNRMLRHTYTRVPRGQQPATPGAPWSEQDDWGDPIAVQDTDAGAPAAVPSLPCLFVDRGDQLIGDQGPVQIDTPTLLVAYDDPLEVGDLVRNVTDNATGTVLLAQAFTDTSTIHAPAGPPMWKAWQLQNAEVQ